MKVKINTKSSDGKDLVLFIEKPTKKHEDAARVVSNRVFSRGIRDKDSLLRKELNSFLRERGMWDDAKQSLQETLSKNINEKVEKLNLGGIELEEAKKLALEIRKSRLELIFLLAETREYDSSTLEAQAENAYFDALISLCTYNEDGSKAFTSYEDYSDKSSEQYAVDSAVKLSELVYGSRREWEKDLPENKFLIEFHFVNEDLELINEDGKRVDREGRLVNEEGRYIDKDGGFIDIDGNKVDEIGNKIVDRKPFLKNGKKIK